MVIFLFEIYLSIGLLFSVGVKVIVACVFGSLLDDRCYQSPLQREDVLEDLLGVSVTTLFPFQIIIYCNYHVYLVMVFHFQVNDMTLKEGRVGISSMLL
jgi:hypothetical protein